jgi:hypothetical protein
MSIEEAAARAGLGTKTWSRYEAGAGIRADKVRSVCKALGWKSLPGDEPQIESPSEHLEIDESHEAWSDALAESCGTACAAIFAAGSDMLLSETEEDLASLSREPRGTHLGQLSHSWLDGSLPEQFVPRYDYDFVYALRAALRRVRNRFVTGQLTAHTVLEEIVVYLILQEAELFADLYPDMVETAEEWRGWLGDILGDTDVEFLLFQSHWVLTPQIAYHFDHWQKNQFYSESNEPQEAE